MPTFRFRPGVRASCAGLVLIALLIAGCGAPAPAPVSSRTAPTTTTPAPSVLESATAAPTAVLPATAPPPSAAPTATIRPATAPPPLPPTATSPARAPRPPVAVPRVPVLTYHHLDVPAARDYSVPAAKFSAQMQWLADQGYQSISPDALLAAAEGTRSLPSHPVLITFDDNYREPYDLAVPVLKAHHFTATFFIMSVTIGKRYFMTADEIRGLDRDGFTIGGHTWDHPLLTGLPDNKLQFQLQQSTDDLTAILGHRPVHFAYPDGVYNPHVAEAVQHAGYTTAFRLFNRDDPVVDPRYMIRRQDIAGAWSMPDFINNVHWMEP